MQQRTQPRARSEWAIKGVAVGVVLCGMLAFAGGAIAAQPPAPGAADLSIVKSDSPDPVQAGQTLTYMITVSNVGPDAAQNVVVTEKLPAGTEYISATSTQGTCDVKGNALTCSLGNLAADPNSPYTAGSVTITLKVKAPAKAGTISNTAEVTSDTGDPNPANNTVTATTKVVGGGGGGQGGNPSCAGVKATIVGTSGADVLKGTSKRDVILARGGSDEISSAGGKDLICAGAGKDRVKAGGGRDVILGAGGRDRLAGQGGDDKVRGQGRGDRLRGGAGDDLLAGGPGHDRCNGGAGHDRLRSCEN